MPEATTLSVLNRARALLALTRPDRVEHLTHLARRHPDGALIRVPGQQFLVTASASAAKHVLIQNSSSYIKGLGQAEARQLIGEGLLTAEGLTWQRQRRAVAPHLRAPAVQSRLSLILASARSNVASLASDSWQASDLSTHLADYTLTCLGHAFGFAPPNAQRIHHAFNTIQDEAIFRSISRGTIPLWLRPRRRRALTQALTTLRQESQTVLGPQPPNEAWATEEGMASLFLAGYETTSSTLTWAAHYLAERPTLQDALAREGACIPSAEAAMSDVGSLRWTNAVFKETIRLRPPVWLLSRRATAADRVDGVPIRAGDEVLIVLPAVNQAGWDNPGGFDPSRFLNQDHGTLMAFGAGPRACPGAALADLEATVWLATAMSQLEFRKVPGPRVRPLARMSQVPLQGHLVEVRRRPAAHEAAQARPVGRVA